MLRTEVTRATRDPRTVSSSLLGDGRLEPAHCGLGGPRRRARRASGHADSPHLCRERGQSERAGAALASLQWLGIVPSFGRPHVCNDNPYSEALFRTLKHTPAYPRLPFASRDAARQWVARLSRGTTPSIVTARYGMSRQTNDTRAPTSPSWRAVACSTSEPGDARRDAGRARFETGHPSPRWYSIPSTQRGGDAAS